MHGPARHQRRDARASCWASHKGVTRLTCYANNNTPRGCLASNTRSAALASTSSCRGRRAGERAAAPPYANVRVMRPRGAFFNPRTPAEHLRISAHHHASDPTMSPRQKIRMRSRHRRALHPLAGTYPLAAVAIESNVHRHRSVARIESDLVFFFFWLQNAITRAHTLSVSVSKHTPK